VCTTDSCNSGTCEYSTNSASCDDGLYCNGSDICAAGSCTHAGDPCSAGETCNETTDSCEASGGGGDIGNTTVLAYVGTFTNRRSVQVTANTAGDLQSISIYHEGGSGGLLLAIFDDVGDSPGTRLGITPEVQISSSAGWETVNLISPVSVSAGQKVWLAWVFESNPGIRYQAGSPDRAETIKYWDDGMPTDFGSHIYFSDEIYSIYATYAYEP
jgi:hypothetical protein